MARISSPARTRGLSALAALAAAGLLGTIPSAAAGASAASPVAANQSLAVLLVGHQVHEAADASSPRLASVAVHRPITGERTVLPVLGRMRSSGGIPWLRVMLPGRPNESTGWIAQQGTQLTSTPWRVQVNLGRRRVSVYLRDRIVKVYAAVVGKPSTPTPTGSFFVEETLKMRAGEPGGPFALALSARSDALQEFEGGPGQIAIHGMSNLGGTLGAAESHGCVRTATATISWLATRIGPGVPVSIVPD
jgi:lipoprotein-anchoring transpeptidase ErfK/SrfK